MSLIDVDSMAHELSMIGLVVRGRLFLERSTIVEGISYANFSQMDVVLNDDFEQHEDHTVCQ